MNGSKIISTFSAAIALEQPIPGDPHQLNIRV
jgi:hypothetical protein